MGQVLPEVRTVGFVKCCQDESGFLLCCLAGESMWNVPKLFSLKALIQLQARTKDCTVSPPRPSLPSIQLSEAASCTAGLAQLYQQGGLMLAWLRSPDWDQATNIFQFFVSHESHQTKLQSLSLITINILPLLSQSDTTNWDQQFAFFFSYYSFQSSR